MVLANLVNEGEMKEAGSLDLTPVRSGGAVRHQVDSKLSLGGLDSSIGGSGRDLGGKVTISERYSRKYYGLPGIPG